MGIFQIIKVLRIHIYLLLHSFYLSIDVSATQTETLTWAAPPAVGVLRLVWVRRCTEAQSRHSPVSPSRPRSHSFDFC